MQSGDPRSLVEAFDPDRLRIAREAAGLLQRELAKQIDVTAAAISQYEKGRARPSRDTLEQIARRLGYPVAFFASDRPIEEAEAAAGFFRKLSRAPARERSKAKVLPLLLRDLINTVEWYVRLPEVEIPQLTATATAASTRIETIAEQVRAAWRLPSGPIRHVVRLLESHGIIVVRLRSGGDSLDAFSRWFPERPVIVLYSDKGDASRSRFDAAHELGHLVMHRTAPPEADWVEEQANCFAAAFLMPAHDIGSELPQTISWSEFMRLKLRWGASIAALLRRARTLDRLDHKQYERAMRVLSSRGWRKQEPSPLGKPEAPVMLERVLRLLEDSEISIRALAKESRLPLKMVQEWVAAASDPRPSVVLDE